MYTYRVSLYHCAYNNNIIRMNHQPHAPPAELLAVGVEQRDPDRQILALSAMVPLGDEDIDRGPLGHAELELRVVLDARVVVAPARAHTAHPLPLGLLHFEKSWGSERSVGEGRSVWEGYHSLRTEEG